MGINPSSKIWNLFGQRAIDGDKEALGQLLENFRPMLISTARRQVPRRLQSLIGASDIVQLTCEDAHLSVGRIKAGNSRQFAGWLLQLLRNNLIDAHRKFVGSQKRSRLREVRDERLIAALEYCDLAGLDVLLKREEIEAVLACFDRVGEYYGELLRWHILEGKSDKEIALAVNRTAGSVRMALNRAKAALRREVLSKVDLRK